jgi:hypothetical protein
MRTKDMDVYKELKKQNEELYDHLKTQGRTNEMLPNELYVQKLIASPYSNNVFGGRSTDAVSQKRINEITTYGGSEANKELANGRKEFSTNNVIKGEANSDVIGNVRILKNSSFGHESINDIRQQIHRTARLNPREFENGAYDELGSYVDNDGKRYVELGSETDFMKKRNKLLQQADIVPVTDKTSLYAKYGMLPDGQTKKYEGLLSAEGEG